MEQDGVKAYYGLVSVSDSPEPEFNYFYMIFENHSGRWLNPGFTLLASPPEGDPQSGFTRFLFSPIPSSDARHPLAVIMYVDADWRYDISLEIEHVEPLLQKYMQMRSEGDQTQLEGIYKQEPFRDEMESKMILKFLGLTNDIGFEFDELTQRACLNQPAVSLTRYRYGDDDVYMIHSNCTDWGGDGTFGKNFLALFRLDKNDEPVWLMRSDRQKEPFGYLIPDVGSYGGGNTITDLDQDGNVELAILQSGGVSSTEDMFELVDGALQSFYHVNSHSEGEASSEADCSAGPPFQDCF